MINNTKTHSSLTTSNNIQTTIDCGEKIKTSPNSLSNPESPIIESNNPNMTGNSSSTKVSQTSRQQQSSVSNGTPTIEDQKDTTASTSNKDINRSSPKNSSSRPSPAKDINHSNIVDRYVEFILWCNPNHIPDEGQTLTLRRAFIAVPKSDGKTFDPWLLFSHVARLESGEIKTWTKLAQDMGVERTDDSSPQKIQQYAVRLKVNINK